MKSPQLTVVVSYYKAIKNLSFILNALSKQSVNNFEVIVSEDDCDLDSKNFINDCKKKYIYPIIHLSQQEDNGFQKNAMLNRSIVASNSNKLAFIDGDCIPHKHFVKAYIENIDDFTFCTARQVFLSEEITKEIKETNSISKLNFFNLLNTKTTSLKNGLYSPIFPLSFAKKGIVGRNWGCSKKVLLSINGFDEDYIRAGVGEDCDIEWRLLKKGYKIKSVQNKAIVYHLYHPRWYSNEDEMYNFDLMYDKIKANHIACLNGIKKL